MDNKEKQAIVEELMQSKEAEDLMKLGMIMYGYQDEKQKLIDNIDKGENQ